MLNNVSLSFEIRISISFRQKLEKLKIVER